MPTSVLFAPLFAMVALTLMVLCATLLVRLAYIKKGEVSLRYFAFMRHDRPGAELPDAVVKVSRNLVNLFEVPVLFYTAILVGAQLDPEDEVLFVLAWSYVALRAIHSVIHCTYNDVSHRFTAFFLSTVALFGIWGRLVVLAYST